MKTPEKNNYLVLVADDSLDDRSLLRAAMRRARQMRIINEVSDGTEVVTYLKGCADFTTRRERPFPGEQHPFPDMLLLDLKMPLMDGFDVLAWLQTQSFPDLTVVVLTDSMQPDHIKRALDMGADFFQVKPRTNHDREAFILALEEHLAGAGLAALRF